MSLTYLTVRSRSKKLEFLDHQFNFRYFGTRKVFIRNRFTTYVIHCTNPTQKNEVVLLLSSLSAIIYTSSRINVYQRYASLLHSWAPDLTLYTKYTNQPTSSMYGSKENLDILRSLANNEMQIPRMTVKFSQPEASLKRQRALHELGQSTGL